MQKELVKITRYLLLTTMVVPLTAYTPTPQERVIQLTKQVEKIETENLKLLKELSLMKKKLKEKEKAARHAFNLFEKEKQHEIDELNASVDRLKREREYSKNSHSKIEKELTAKNREISKQAQQIKKMKQQLQQETSQLQASIVQLNNVIAEVTGERDVLAQDRTELAEQVAALESRQDHQGSGAQQNCPTWTNGKVAGLSAIVALATFALTRHHYNKPATS